MPSLRLSECSIRVDRGTVTVTTAPGVLRVTVAMEEDKIYEKTLRTQHWSASKRSSGSKLIDQSPGKIDFDVSYEIEKNINMQVNASFVFGKFAFAGKFAIVSHCDLAA